MAWLSFITWPTLAVQPLDVVNKHSMYGGQPADRDTGCAGATSADVYNCVEPIYIAKRPRCVANLLAQRPVHLHR